MTLKTLADLLGEHAIEDISLLKLDVEGHELAALKGYGWERLRRVPFVFIEIEKRMLSRSRALLFYLFAVGFRHGLAFQHDEADPHFFTLFKLEAGDDPDLHLDDGDFANVVLAREELFSPDDSFFGTPGLVFNAEQLEGRLNP